MRFGAAILNALRHTVRLAPYHVLAQIPAVAYNVSGKASLDAYDDGTLVSGYASEAMAWAAESGIIQGIGGNKLDPTGKATRAQLATMLMRFDELIKDEV